MHFFFKFVKSKIVFSLFSSIDFFTNSNDTFALKIVLKRYLKLKYYKKNIFLATGYKKIIIILFTQ